MTATIVDAAPRSPLAGGWMWYDARTYSLTEWDSTCAGAKAWGMSGVHPKVGDGEGIWYNGSDATLIAMKKIANNHGLGCVPYYYCWGNTRGSSVLVEAEDIAHVGNLFGAVIPDMEDQWVNEPAWAVQFGQIIRKTFSGLVIPTVYANPREHPEPIVALNPYVNGWMPQVYFAVWTPNTASHAKGYFLPEWQALGATTTIKPLMPIVEVGNYLPAQEVVNFITLMSSITDYIGFWYDVPYAAYVDYVKPHLPALPAPVSPTPPLPVSKLPAPVPPPTQGPVMTQTPVSSPSPIWHQGYNRVQLTSLWKKNRDVPLNWLFAIPLTWEKLMNDHPDIAIGSPITDEHEVSIGGYSWIIQTFSSGSSEISLLYDKTTQQVFLYHDDELSVTSSPVTPPVPSVKPVEPLPVTPAPVA